MENLANSLRTLLARNIVRFTFRKVNGEIRHAVGTRNLQLAEKHTGCFIQTPKGEEQPNSYFDVEKMGWRSYKPELLLSIDGVEPLTFKTPVEERVPLFKPFSELSEHDKGVVADLEMEMPSHTESFPLSEILKGLFGGIGFGSGMPIKGSKVAGTPVSSGKNTKDLDELISMKDTDRGRVLSRWIGLLPIEDIAIPTDAIPVGVPVDDFAKRVAHYVVEELIERLTR